MSAADDQRTAEMPGSEVVPSLAYRQIAAAVGLRGDAQPSEVLDEVDRLRAELAKTRRQLAIVHDAEWSRSDALAQRLRKLESAGDALADAKNWVGHVVEAERWRSVRGDAPAPAEPPVARCRCGVQRGNEHLRNCRERCQDCGGDLDGPRRCACVEPLAVELPVTLSSVDDVAAKVCAGGGWKLTWSLEPDGLTREWEHDSGVHVRAEQGATIMVVTVRPASHGWPHWRGSGPDVHLDVLLAAIEAARGGSR